MNNQQPLVLYKNLSASLVKIVQEKLKQNKYYKTGKVDGIFGANTEKAVIRFQEDHRLRPTGIVGPQTLEALGLAGEEFYADSDVPDSSTWIKDYHLPTGEFVQDNTEKNCIFLHHTLGHPNPFKQVDRWAADDRGRIGTNYLIGGPNFTRKLPATDQQLISGGEHDGTVVRAIEDKYRGFHLGAISSNMLIDHSLSIELCSSGGLEKKADGFYNWFDQKVDESQVIELDTPFKGNYYYQGYSMLQLNSLKQLLLHLRDKHDIDIRSGLQEWLKRHEDQPAKAFEFDHETEKGKKYGLFSHSNVRQDKADAFPDPNLIQMLKSL